MNKRRFIISTGAVLMVAMLATGYAAVAAEYGSADDPLITQSYLEKVLMPSLTAKAEAAAKSEAAAYTSDMTARINQVTDAIGTQLQSLANALVTDEDFVERVAQAGGGTGTAQAEWQTVTLSAGKTLKLDAGTQVIVRTGSASAAGTGLTDVTAGSRLTAGDTAVASHLFMATQDGAGLKAGASARVLVSGGYTVS